ncbi:ankyrin repeat domain-containing protein 26-like [Suricata suricatta]|uniref:ankyrin repeat domain-containing protein 26-like n=1 Tax=Suricata suricatta TaxID=37032 RepID=UPI001155E66E|nr:ankyrin repeat domain-containing protein 26-like [Suricata suricatta]
MKKIFGLCVKKGVSPSDAACSSRKNGKGEGRERNRTHHSQAGYHIRKRDLRMIHEAATEGNADAVQDILRFGINGLNDRDRKRRTPLHLACANGHSEVVAVLVERKCLLNLFDNKKRTALTKAVQCADEKSVTILLEHGADPNFMDKSGNTALHYAVFGDNISIAEKLLLHNADVEARNKAGLTPLHLARKENNEMMVELLAEKTAAGDSVHNTKSDCHRISSHQEDNTSKNSCQSRHLGTPMTPRFDSSLEGLRGLGTEWYTCRWLMMVSGYKGKSAGEKVHGVRSGGDPEPACRNP